MHLNGRSLLEVLTDVVHFLSEQRGQAALLGQKVHQMDKQATISAAVPSCAAVPGMREALLGTKGLIIIEVCVCTHTRIRTCVCSYIHVYAHAYFYAYIYSLFPRR